MIELNEQPPFRESTNMKTGTTEAAIRALMEEWTNAVRTKDIGNE